MADNTASLADLAALIKQDFRLQAWFARTVVADYAGFVEQLYLDLKLVADRITKNPQFYLLEGEDATTGRIADMLYTLGYDCSFGVARGGNVDITVEKSRLGFVWIGEAKKFNSVADLREGFLQLATRYTPGSNSSGILYGGIFAYLRRPNAKSNMDSWREELKKLPEAPNVQITDCALMGPLAFNSEHAHASMGLPMKIWHLCFQLHHDPKDKSARKRRPPAAKKGKVKKS